jgi:hypothetical protein
LLSIFGSPQKKKNTRKSKNIFTRKPKKIIAVRKRCWNAQKMTKNWLRRFKNTKIKI